MASTYTPNIQLEEPARGDQVGVWDTSVNSNMTLVDLVVGAIATISLNNSPVVLSAAQFQSKTITFNSTLTGSCAITFPSTFTKSYEIQNLCTGSSAFVITLTTTAAGGQVICCPPGEIIECVNDGTNLKFKNLDRIGAYWDYAGSSVPAWVSGCTVPPYLNCDAGTFSATTYPTLAIILGSTTLPDSKGRVRAALDQGAARLSSAVAGFSPNTVGSAGGSQLLSAHTHANTLTDLGHTHNVASPTNNVIAGSGNDGSAGALFAAGPVTSGGNNSTPMSITNVSAGTGTAANVPPTYIGGLTLIRAA